MSGARLSKLLLRERILAHPAPPGHGSGDADLRLVQEEGIRLLAAMVDHAVAWKPAEAMTNWGLTLQPNPACFERSSAWSRSEHACSIRCSRKRDRRSPEQPVTAARSRPWPMH